MEVLDNIPFNIEVGDVVKRMRLNKENKRFESTVEELLEIVRPIAKPKAVYTVAYIENKNEDSLYIGGIKFISRVLRVNLDKVERVFPYVATCGREIDSVSTLEDDLIKSFCLDQIKEMAVRTAVNYLQDYLVHSYALGHVSRMNPGSLQDWPLIQQRELFALFGDVEKLIGVKLTESCLMLPLKSVSGIFFPTEIRFESCQLCPRPHCIGRRAPYDPELVKRYRKQV